MFFNGASGLYTVYHGNDNGGLVQHWWCNDKNGTSVGIDNDGVVILNITSGGHDSYDGGNIQQNVCNTLCYKWRWRQLWKYGVKCM